MDDRSKKKTIVIPSLTGFGDMKDYLATLEAERRKYDPPEAAVAVTKDGLWKRVELTLDRYLVSSSFMDGMWEEVRYELCKMGEAIIEDHNDEMHPFQALMKVKIVDVDQRSNYRNLVTSPYSHAINNVIELNRYLSTSLKQVRKRMYIEGSGVDALWDISITLYVSIFETPKNLIMI